jgi:hypothetical protein
MVLGGGLRDKREPVNQEALELAVHHVLLFFRNVVAHVIHHVHVQIIRRCLEHFAKRLPSI